MSHKNWKEVLVQMYDLGRAKLKTIKRTKDVFKEEVMRTVLMATKNDMGDVEYRFEKVSADSEDKIIVSIDKIKMGYLLDLKNSWEDLTKYMCELYDSYENQEANRAEDEKDTGGKKNPKVDLQNYFKKLDQFYESYTKGKSSQGAIIMDREAGEPAMGGFTYCRWLLNKSFLDHIYGLVRYAKYYRSIMNKLEQDPESIPEFRRKSIFNMYMKHFIQVFTTLFNNPNALVDENPFHRIPHITIMSKFVLWNVKNESEQEIVKFLVKPIQDNILAVEDELIEIEKNELHRIKVDLNQNKNFYAKMKLFDENYYKAWTLMAYNFRQDQLLFVKDTVEWIYHSALNVYFTKEETEMKRVLIAELIPSIVAYNSVIKMREYLDKKASGFLQRRYPEELEFPELDPNENEVDKEIRLLYENEVKSVEYFEVDKKTKKTRSYREFLLQEIVSEEKKPEYAQYLDKCAKRMYDIREDVRIYIKCDLIMEVWKKYKPQDLAESREEEIKELKRKNKQFKLHIVKRIEETRQNGDDLNNYCPHLQEYEEQKLLKEPKLTAIDLNMSFLKTPHVFNNIHYNKEDRFSTLYNSDNCYEDARVKELLKDIKGYLIPQMYNNPTLEYYIRNVFEFYVRQKNLVKK